MAQAAQEMRRVQRNLDAALAKRAFRRAAMRDALQKAAYGEHHNYVPVVHRADFECFKMCLDCGYFGNETGQTCPSCDGGGWVDLTFDESSDMVRDIEARRRTSVPRWVKATVAAGLSAAVVVVGIATGAVFPFAVSAVAAAIPAYFLLLRPVTRLLSRSSLRRPARWHGPLAPDRQLKRAGSRAFGTVTEQGGLLTSPFGGLPCVAFEVALRYYDTRSPRGADWLLRESRSIDFQVGGEQVERGTAILAMPLEEVLVDGAAETKTRVDRFLRERGLVDNDGELEVFETVLVAGRAVELEVHDDPALVIVSDPGNASGRRRRRNGPYR